MADQMTFEQRKVRKIQEAAHRQEVDNLQPHHPEINANSQKIIDMRRRASAWDGASNGSMPKGLALETSLGVGAAKQQERLAKVQRQMRADLSFSPRINSKSKKLRDRGIEDLHLDTQRRIAAKQEQIRQQNQRENVGKVQIGSVSDKLVHDRFEQDFGAACRELELTDTHVGEPLRADVKISCAQMS